MVLIKATHIYTGKVKSIWQYTPPTDEVLGDGYMDLSANRFSLFDYGEKAPMPWDITGKGRDQAWTTKRMFQVLEDAGIPTHFKYDMGNFRMRIKLARMLGYDDIKPGETINYRVPIECVFSKVITPPASAHRRLLKGKDRPDMYGADHVPVRGESLVLPRVATSFSTKIESADVYKSLDELAKAAGLVGNEAQRLKDLTIACGNVLIEDAQDVGIIVADGKFEFLLGPGRNLIVGDTGYTYDENRFLFELGQGSYVDLSKQLPRNIYTMHGWKKQMDDAKAAHPDDPSQWPDPPQIPDDEMRVCIDACDAVSYAIARRRGGPNLQSVARRAADILDRLKNQFHIDEAGDPI